MSALIPVRFRIATIGIQAVRRYAAAAAKLAVEDEPITSPQAGPSRPRATQPNPKARPATVRELRKIPLPPAAASTVRGLEDPTVLRLPTKASGTGKHTGGGSSGPAEQAKYDQRPRKRKPKSLAQVAALRKAEAFASAIKATTDSQAPSTSGRHAALATPTDGETSEPEATPATRIEQPTLQDLLDRKPTERPNYDRANYPGRYQRAYDAIGNAFLRRQLIALARELGLWPTNRDSKAMVVPMILAHWGWPPVEKVEDESDVQRDFEMESADLFLLIRDEKVLRSFMGRGRSVAFEIVEPAPASQDGIARSTLRAKGSLRSLQHLSDIIKKKNESRITETLPIAHLDGFRPSPTLLSAIPNIAESFVEIVDGDKMRITSSHFQNAKFANSLLAMAAMRTVPPPANAHVSAILTGPGHATDDETGPSEAITLSPFHTPSSQHPPWPVAAAIQQAALARLRRSTVWGARPSRIGETQRNEAIEASKAVPAPGAVDENVTLAEIAIRVTEQARSTGFAEAETSTLVTFGHALIPVADSLSLDAIPHMNRTPSSTKPTNTSHPIFVSAATPHSIQFPLETPTQRIRRLTYRRLQHDSPDAAHRFIVFTYVYPGKKGDAADAAAEEEKEWQDELDAMMRKAEEDVLAEDAEEEALDKSADGEKGVQAEAPAEAVEADVASTLDTAVETSSDIEGGSQRRGPIPIQCEVHTVSTALLRLPDRPIDAHLTARSITVLPPDQSLSGIREFFRSIIAKDAGIRALQFIPPVRTTIQIDGMGHRFVLFKDEDCEITEADQGDGVVLRTVKSSEPGLKWSTPSTHSELEIRGESIPTQFWRSFAEVSRDVPANAGVLQRDRS